MIDRDLDIHLPTVKDIFTPPQEVCFVTKSASLKKAWTIMRSYGFSQLLVVNQKPSTDDLKYSQVIGCFSWESFAVVSIRDGQNYSVDDSIEPFIERKESGKFVCVRYDEPVIDVAMKLQDHEYVIAKDDNDVVRAFVTPYDVSKLYLDLVKPYSELQKVEIFLRKMINRIPQEKIVECHHLKPLSDDCDTYNSVNELITLCPNCHSLAHILLNLDDKFQKVEYLLSGLKQLCAKIENNSN